MNLADAVNPLTLRIDLAMFTPHAIVIPLAPKRVITEEHIRRALAGGPQERLLAMFAEHDAPIAFAQALEESGIRKSTFGSMLVRLTDQGEIVRSGTTRHFRYALRRT